MKKIHTVTDSSDNTTPKMTDWKVGDRGVDRLVDSKRNPYFTVVGINDNHMLVNFDDTFKGMTRDRLDKSLRPLTKLEKIL